MTSNDLILLVNIKQIVYFIKLGSKLQKGTYSMYNSVLVRDYLRVYDFTDVIKYAIRKGNDVQFVHYSVDTLTIISVFIKSTSYVNANLCMH